MALLKKKKYYSPRNQSAIQYKKILGLKLRCVCGANEQTLATVVFPSDGFPAFCNILDLSFFYDENKFLKKCASFKCPLYF